MHGTLKLFIFGVTCSLSGFSFAFREALETAFQPPSRPPPCPQAVCWSAHHLRVTKMEQIVGIEWDDNGSSNLPCVRMPRGPGARIEGNQYFKEETPPSWTQKTVTREDLSLNRLFWDHKSTNLSDRGCYIELLTPSIPPSAYVLFTWNRRLVSGQNQEGLV